MNEEEFMSTSPVVALDVFIAVTAIVYGKCQLEVPTPGFLLMKS